MTVIFVVSGIKLFAVSTLRNLSNVTKQVYAIHINQWDVGESSFVLKDQDGNIYCSKALLEEWNVICSDMRPYVHEGVDYYCLKEFEGAKYDIDSKTSTLHLTFPGKFLVGRNVPLMPDYFVYPQASPLGAFVNYDTIALKSNGSPEELRGYFSPGMFTNFGVGISDFIVQHVEGHHSENNDFVRLNSFWRYDIPSDLQTLILGDAYIPSATWGGSAGFGGIQFRRNFETQPAFITFPLPSLEGETALPSVLDLYVNDALVKHGKEKPGPFSIDSIPVTTGSGEMKMVTTDILGRQQQVVVPYYAAPELLKPGLQNYAYSAGFLRKRFGRRSNEYDKFTFVGDHAVGITTSITGKVRAEFIDDQKTAGGGADFLVDKLGVVDFASAVSSKSGKQGELLATGFRRQANNNVSFGGNVKWMSKNFVQLRMQRKTSPKYVLTTFIGFGLFELGNFSASYIRQEFRKKTDLDLVTATFSTAISHLVTVNLSAMTTIHGRNHHTIFLTLTSALGDSTNASIIGKAQKHSNQGAFQLVRNLPAGPGYGYNLFASSGQQKNYHGLFTAQNNTATLALGGSHHREENTGQAQLRGSMVLMNGSAYLSRDLGQGFAVVNMPDYPDVGIYYKNEFMGKTDADGTLLIPRLLAYQENPIRVDIRDLPMDAEIESDVVKPVPYYMSGLIVDFPIKPSAGAMMQLLLPSGEPVPLGSLVSLNNSDVPIGYDGKVYITGLAEYNTLHVTSKGEQYACEVHYQKSKDPVPDLGVIQCTK